MNFVAALLLISVARGGGGAHGHRPLHPGPPTSEDEEAAFWLLVALADDGGILYDGLYGAELAGCHVELRCLSGLVQKKVPKVAATLAAAGVDASMLATDWFLCLFATALPAEVRESVGEREVMVVGVSFFSTFSPTHSRPLPASGTPCSSKAPKSCSASPWPC